LPVVIADFYPDNFLGNSDCPLDEFFGSPQEATRVDAVELDTCPDSLVKLTEHTAPLLKRYMRAATDGLALAQVLHVLLPVLWLLNDEGEVFFALEEVCDVENQDRKFPLARNWKVPAGTHKLGHPSLIKGRRKSARIAGEMLFDPDPSNGKDGWVITNGSGRFGFGRHRVESHLLNVAELLASYEINVDASYIPPLPS